MCVGLVGMRLTVRHVLMGIFCLIGSVMLPVRLLPFTTTNTMAYVHYANPNAHPASPPPSNAHPAPTPTTSTTPSPTNAHSNAYPPTTRT